MFTTQDATGPMRRLRAATFAKAAAPMVKNLAFLKTTTLYDVYTGEYDAPNASRMWSVRRASSTLVNSAASRCS